MATTPWIVNVADHPGSSAQEIEDEPDWGSGHHHRIGFKNRDNRVPGVTHKHDEYDEEVERVRRGLKQLRDQAKKGRLVNFRDLINAQEVLRSVPCHQFFLTTGELIGSSIGLPPPAPREPVRRLALCSRHDRRLGQERAELAGEHQEERSREEEAGGGGGGETQRRRRH